MRILYGIQGTGNGHLARAIDVIPALERHGAVDLLVSGSAAGIALPREVKYRPKGLGFVFGRAGGIDLWSSYSQSDLRRLHREIADCPVRDYDLVVTDFEPVSAWAARKAHRPCIGLSHQSAVLHPASPKPRKAFSVGRAVLTHYAPTDRDYGFHFRRYARELSTPIIRAAVRRLEPVTELHYTVYLPAYDDEKVIKHLSQVSEVRWHVFSKRAKRFCRKANVSLYPVDQDAWLESLRTCTGVLCAAGFETPAEALHLGKKLLVVPMKGQYEQACNAVALREMGVPVLKKLSTKRVEEVRRWVLSAERVAVDYPNETQAVVDRAVAEAMGQLRPPPASVLPGSAAVARSIGAYGT